jgi:hypothetical protein
VSYLAVLRKQIVNYLVTLVNDVLDLARLDNQSEFVLTFVNLNAFW